MVKKHCVKRWGAALALTLAALGCSSSGGSASSSGGGEAGAGGNPGATSSSGVVASSSSVGAGGFGGGPAQFVCDPPAEPGSLYELSAKSYDINDVDPVSMCKYRGKVLLAVNTAAV
jgi:hypothetical protein